MQTGEHVFSGLDFAARELPESWIAHLRGPLHGQIKRTIADDSAGDWDITNVQTRSPFAQNADDRGSFPTYMQETVNKKDTRGHSMLQGPTLFQAENLGALPCLSDLARLHWRPVSALNRPPRAAPDISLEDKLRF